MMHPGKRITRLLLLSMVMISGLIGVHAQKALPDTAVIFRVNGSPVIAREFRQMANAERSRVIRYFRDHYKLEYSQDFWSQKKDGISPEEYLKKRTLDTLTAVKVQQILALEQGITGDISYSGFLRNLEKENKRRLRAKENNQVIYGPVQYSETVYYNYIFSNMVNELKTALAETGFHITDEMLRTIYDNKKDSLFLREAYTVIKLLTVKFRNTLLTNDEDSPEREEYILTGQIADSVFKNIYSHKGLIKRSGTGYSPEIITERMVFNDSAAAPEEKTDRYLFLKKKTDALSLGQISEVFDYQHKLMVVMVTEKKQTGYRSFASCRSFILETETDKMYNILLREKIRSAVIEINQQNLDQLKF